MDGPPSPGAIPARWAGDLDTSYGAGPGRVSLVADGEREIEIEIDSEIAARAPRHLERIVRKRARLQRHAKQRVRASHSRRHT